MSKRMVSVAVFFFVAPLATLMLFPAVASAHNDPLTPAPGQSVAKPSSVPSYSQEQRASVGAPRTTAAHSSSEARAKSQRYLGVAAGLAVLTLVGCALSWVVVKARSHPDSGTDIDRELVRLLADERDTEVTA